MKILYFANNAVGLEVLRFLVEEAGEEIAGLVVHPPDRARYRDEMIELSGLPEELVFSADTLRHPVTVSALRSLGAEIGLTVFLAYILRPDVLQLFPAGCVNVHPAYLPYNRGRNPNVWSIVECTPAGATLHYLDEGVDTGDIIARRRVEVTPFDTGGTLYGRLEDACTALFRATWLSIKQGTAPRQRQDGEAATAHRGRDVEAIDRIELDRRYTARELIDVLRARTFSPYPGAYFEADGERVYLRLQLLRESELAGDGRSE